MKYFGKMLTRLMVENDFISQEDRIEVEKEMNEGLETDNKYISFFNKFMKTPFGVIISIILYVFANRMINRANRELLNDNIEDRLKSELKVQVLEDLLKK